MGGKRAKFLPLLGDGPQETWLGAIKQWGQSLKEVPKPSHFFLGITDYFSPLFVVITDYLVFLPFPFGLQTALALEEKLLPC